ncbi:hypothetical protein K432DRAFT_315083, partial [Lepidopterella palustris CBS 459.81]
EIIIIDFITKLLKLKELIIKVVYNFILVIINKLISYTYFLLYKKVINAKVFLYILLRILIVKYRVLNKIILN